MTISPTVFLSDPEGSIRAGEEVPASLVRKAWHEHESFREDVAYALAASVSANGAFGSEDDVLLRVLGATLEPEEAADLYGEILEQSLRLELEWRPAFLSYFPASAALLPPTQDAAILRATLEQQILAGHEEGFADVVESLLALPDGRAALREETDSGETLHAFAQRLGRDRLAAVLRDAARR
jgi:hypothetical protein